MLAERQVQFYLFGTTVNHGGPGLRRDDSERAGGGFLIGRRHSGQVDQLHPVLHLAEAAAELEMALAEILLDDDLLA